MVANTTFIKKLRMLVSRHLQQLVNDTFSHPAQIDMTFDRVVIICMTNVNEMCLTNMIASDFWLRRCVLGRVFSLFQFFNYDFIT